MNFEVLMMICFGISWPVRILKSLRTKIVIGKSPLYMIILCAGYSCGAINKMQTNPDWVIYMYIANLLMVIFDLILYYRYIGENTLRIKS